MKKNKKINTTNTWFLITSIIVLIVMMLIFLIIGFGINSTKIYKFSGSGEYLSFKNGLIIISPKTNIINIPKFRENDYTSLVKKLKIDFYIGGKKIYSYNKEQIEGFKIDDALKDESIYIEKKVIEKEIKSNIEKKSYIKISINSMDNKNLVENIMLDIYKY